MLAQLSPAARELDGDRSVESKLRPPMDTIEPSPLLGWLNLATSLTTGPSKVSVWRPVPTALPTEIIDVPYSDATLGLMHATVVEDVHADVLHTASDSAAVAERSHVPKSSPDTVTELPPLTALFSCPCDRTPASKLYPTVCVPMPSPTVTIDVSMLASAALDKQLTVVADDQDDVLHRESDSDALMEKS